MTSAMNLADASVRHSVLASGPLGAWRTRFDADGTGRLPKG